MLWALDRFDYTLVRGWVCLSDRKSSAELELLVDDREPIHLLANLFRPGLLRSGVHETGNCGFDISSDLLETFADARQVSLVEQSTKTLLYRYFLRPREFIEERVFFVTFPYTDSGTLWPLLADHFRLYYPNAHELEEETVNVLSIAKFASSVLMIGAINGQMICRLADRGAFEFVTVIAEPRIRLFNIMREVAVVARNSSPDLELSTGSVVARLVASIKGVDLSNDNDVGRWAENLPLDVAEAISNPLTKALSGVPTNQAVSDGDVASALETLARFRQIEVSNQSDRFLENFIAMHLSSGARHEQSLNQKAPETSVADSPQLARLYSVDEKLYRIIAYGSESAALNPDEAFRIAFGRTASSRSADRTPSE